MKNKGKSIQLEGVSEVTERAVVLTSVPESPIQNPQPISVNSGIFEEDVEIDDVVNEDEEDDEDDEEEDDEAKKDDADDGTSGIKVTEESNEENVDDYLQDDANEEPENAEGEGEHVDDQNVDDSEKLILRLEPDIEEGEIRHTYTLDEIIKLTHFDENEFKFDFEEELNKFDINQQHDYEYKYVEETDNYDRVEVEDCSDEEILNVDTFDFPMLVKFFSQANIDGIIRRVEECLKDKNVDGTSKDVKWEERKKWFRKDTEWKFKRSLKFYKRDRDVSLGDIISWGFLPQVNAYAICREYGVQYFAYIQDIMSLPWRDVEELPKVRTLNYPVRERDEPTWGLMKYEAFKYFKHRKLHYPKKVRKINPVIGSEETILKIKKSRVIKNIPLPKIEQDFHKGFLCWVYSCLSTETVITYRVENEVRHIYVYDPLWLVNCSAKDIECLFMNKVGFKAEDKEQAMLFQKVIEKKEAPKAEKERKSRKEKDKMLRHTVVQRMAEEEKRAVEENEKLRKLLLKKPKQMEEKFKSL
ncbi:hypothetical protein Hanom_Chr13g01195551 [Helianthus anomalus]